jgi:hypothetical protein
MYCYSNNGMSMRAVDANYVAQTGEVTFPAILSTDQLTQAFAGYAAAVNKLSIEAQILALEAQQTPRRIRSAIAGTDSGWLAALEAQIVALRAQL